MGEDTRPYKPENGDYDNVLRDVLTHELPHIPSTLWGFWRVLI